MIDEPPRAGRFLVTAGEELLIGRKLLERKLVVALEAKELLQVQGKRLLNGVFGVTKDKALGAEAGGVAGKPVLRFIMNLTATNSVQHDYAGDIGAQPSPMQWRAFHLHEHEQLVWSWEDLRGCFYIFRLPRVWAPHFAFDYQYDSAELGIR